MIDNSGTFDFADAECNETAFPTSLTTISNTAFDLCNCLTDEYLGTFPVDPGSTGTPAGGVSSEAACSTYNTDYRVMQNAAGVITLDAPSAEGGETILISR